MLFKDLFQSATVRLVYCSSMVIRDYRQIIGISILYATNISLTRWLDVLNLRPRYTKIVWPHESTNRADMHWASLDKSCSQRLLNLSMVFRSFLALSSAYSSKERGRVITRTFAAILEAMRSSLSSSLCAADLGLRVKCLCVALCFVVGFWEGGFKRSFYRHMEE